MGALSLGTFQVINGAQLLVLFFPLVAGISLRAGGGWVSPSDWWEKSILGLGIRLEQYLEGGYGQMLPPAAASLLPRSRSLSRIRMDMCTLLPRWGQEGPQLLGTAATPDRALLPAVPWEMHSRVCTGRVS